MIHPRRRFPLALALLVSVAALAGCGGDKATGPTSIAGTYALRTVNGATLPLGVPYGGGEITVTAGSLTLGPGSSYHGTVSVAIPIGGITVPQTFPDTGSYTHASDGSVTLTTSDGTQTTGTLRGDTLTFARQLVTIGQFTLAFVRE